MAEKDKPQKFAGRYDSLEEFERGHKNTQAELNRLQKSNVQMESLLKEQMSRQDQRDAQMIELMKSMGPNQGQVPLTTEEGALNEEALYNQINGLTESINNLQSSIPGIVENQLQGLLSPLQQAQAAKGEFIAETPDWKESEFNAVLASNASLNRTFQALVANPDTAKDAYATVWSIAQANKPPTAIDEGKKLSAGNPAPSAGPAADFSDEDVPNAKKLEKLRKVAQATGDPHAGVKFMEAMMEGSTEFEKLKEMEKNR